MSGGKHVLFGVDEGADHGAPGGFDHVRIGLMRYRQMFHLAYHLLHALRRGYLLHIALERCGLLHIGAALGNQCHQLAVDLVDVAANLLKRSTGDNVVHGESFRWRNKQKGRRLVIRGLGKIGNCAAYSDPTRGTIPICHTRLARRHRTTGLIREIGQVMAT